MGIICFNIFTVSGQKHWCCDLRILMTKQECDDKAFKLFLSPVEQTKTVTLFPLKHIFLSVCEINYTVPQELCGVLF